MAIDPLSTWKSTLAALPKVADASWAPNFAAWYAGRIIGITTSPAALVPTGFLLTFNTALFASGLVALTPVGNALAGITGFANAWEAAILTSVYPATLTLLPGSFIPPTSPTTLFSAITSVLITPASIAAAKAKIIELASSPPVDDVNNSEFPQKFRDATLLLKINVIGLDSQPPPTAGPGPQPLNANNVPLI